MKSIRSAQLTALVTAMLVCVNAAAIEMDLAVPQSQARSLELDLGRLNQFNYLNDFTDHATALILKTKGPITGQVLKRWLDERVSLIVSETLDLESSIRVAPGVAIYPEPKTFPSLDSPPAPPQGTPQTPDQPQRKVYTVMSNMGAGLYLMAKENRVLLALKKSEGNLLPLVSPREGFIQIGEGLFLPKLRVNEQVQDAPANSVSRLSTLFHEARHSDGHGASLGFMHAICPEGHSYAGHPACDKNLNGPYSVGAQVMKTLTQACGDCSTKEKTILKMIEADSRSRILKTFKDSGGRVHQAKNWSDQPERMLSFIPAKKARLE